MPGVIGSRIVITGRSGGGYLTNATPVLASAGAGTPLAYTENDAATAIFPDMVVTDPGDTMASATITINTATDGDDELTCPAAAGLGLTSFYAVNAMTGTLTVSGAASSADYQTALRSVAYRNTSDLPQASTHTITAKINDGIIDSNTVSRTVNITSVDDAPVLSGVSGTLSYSENDSERVIASGLTITDVDDANLESALVSATANWHAGQDFLNCVTPGSLTPSYNQTLGTVTLTGTATKAVYQTALRSVTFNNTSQNPNTQTRTISFKVNDGDTDSNTVTKDIAVAGLPTAAVVTTTGSTNTFTQGVTPTVIDSGLTITDADSATFASGQVWITTSFSAAAQDTLGFTDQNGITGSYAPTTGILTLTGTASVASYQAALRTVTYSNAWMAGTRTISFKVNDGSVDSNTATRALSVALPPELAAPAVTPKVGYWAGDVDGDATQNAAYTADFSTPKTCPLFAPTWTQKWGSVTQALTRAGTPATTYNIQRAKIVKRALLRPALIFDGNPNGMDYYDLVGSATTLKFLTSTFDFDVLARLNPLKLGKSWGLFGNTENTGPGLAFDFTSAGKLQIYFVDSGITGGFLFADTLLAYTPGKWQKLRISADGANVRASLDGGAAMGGSEVSSTFIFTPHPGTDTPVRDYMLGCQNNAGAPAAPGHFLLSNFEIYGAHITDRQAYDRFGQWDDYHGTH